MRPFLYCGVAWSGLEALLWLMQRSGRPACSEESLWGGHLSTNAQANHPNQIKAPITKTSAENQSIGTCPGQSWAQPSPPPRERASLRRIASPGRLPPDLLMRYRDIILAKSPDKEDKTGSLISLKHHWWLLHPGRVGQCPGCGTSLNDRPDWLIVRWKPLSTNPD